VGARTAFTQRDLLGTISADGATSQTTPDIADKADPWQDKPRLNLLILGGDGGEGREGVRPDTQIVASIDTHTGETTMISLPRNMQHMPFPDDSPLAANYPNGFSDPNPDELEQMLNAVYRNVPAAYPDISGSDANKWAVEGALGIEIDYYILVNLRGFQAIVDAIGGVTLDVPRDIPIGNKSLPGGGCTRANGYIEAGPAQELDGYEALWFARSRCGSDDYDRMARQQCVMNAIVDKADPATLLTQYQALAAATKDIVFTDIPQDLFPALIELGLIVKGANLESLSLDNKFFAAMGRHSYNPDYDELHTRIAEILAPTPAPTTPATPAATTPGAIEAAPAAEAATTETVTEPAPTETAERDPEQPVEAGSIC
jgi:LCP family protein required for cell wall assembly